MTTFDWLSDLQPLYAAQETWLDGSYNRQVLWHLLPSDEQPFAIACGAGLLAEHVRRFRFSPAVIQRLGQVTDVQGRSMFQESFLNHLQRMRLRVQVSAAPEGTLLLPGEPVLVAQGPLSQVLLLGSAFRLLIWESTHWATLAARREWAAGKFTEEDTPPPGSYPFHPKGWRDRALYIGGAESVLEGAPEASWDMAAGFDRCCDAAGKPLWQIRRLFTADHPVGDVWLNPKQDAAASVSHTHVRLASMPEELHMSRFQNLLQAVLIKGHPVLNNPGAEYLRQRTWKQMHAFHEVDLTAYPKGWMG